MSKSYFDERDKHNIEKISANIDKLPDFCFEYFIGIADRTSTLTRLNYSMDLNIFFDYLSKRRIKKPVKDITLDDINSLKAMDIEAYMSYLTYYMYDGVEHKNTEKGKARKLASVRSLFKYLFNRERITSNVASKVETPKLHDKEIIRLENDEVKKLLNQAEDPYLLTKTQQIFNKHTRIRDIALLSLFLGTGIRISECVGINIEDIDFSTNAFKITRKGGNQVVLYFSEEVADALREYYEQRSSNSKVNPKEHAMFLSMQNKRITVRAVELLVKKYSSAIAPLKRITPHKLRSTYGTNLYRETKDIYIVAAVLGHRDVNTTKKHYAAISEDIRKSASTKVKLR